MLTTSDVAKLLGLSTEAVKKLVQRGRLKTLRRGKGKPIVYDSASVAMEKARRSPRQDDERESL